MYIHIHSPNNASQTHYSKKIYYNVQISLHTIHNQTQTKGYENLNP